MTAEVRSVELLQAELERVKSLYEQEKEQLEEFQRYSKELEAEMDVELMICKQKITDLDGRNRKLEMELDEIKKRYEKERLDFLSKETMLKTKAGVSEECCKELRQKLRKIEQANDDLERRERIQTQELLDWAMRYEKCLERCAYLEAGMFSNNDNKMELSPIADSVPNDKIKFVSDANTTRISNSWEVSSVPEPKTSFDVTRSSSQSHTNEERYSIINDGFVSPPTTKMKLNDSSDKNDSYIKHSFGLSTHPFCKDSRRSSEIVSNLFRKIEEVERQVNPKKYIIHRTPNHRK